MVQNIVLNKKYENNIDFFSVYEITENPTGVNPGERKRAINKKVTFSINKKINSEKLPKNIYFYRMEKSFSFKMPNGKDKISKQIFNGIIERKQKNYKGYRNYRAAGNCYWKESPPGSVMKKNEDKKSATGGYNLFQNFSFIIDNFGKIRVRNYQEQGSIESEIKIFESTMPITTITSDFRLKPKLRKCCKKC